MGEFEINGKRVGDNCEPYIIAEAGINHNGDIELAKKMIHAAKDAGADAVKFQTFHAEDFIQDKTTTYTYTSQGKEVTESMLEMFERNEFTPDEWRELKRFCDVQRISFMSTPQNVSDLELLLDIGIPAIKVGSDDFVNIPLIRRYASEKLPILLSCGMAGKDDIDTTLKTVENAGNNSVVLFLCTSQYPTPPEDVNILKLDTISQEYNTIVPGFSDHTQGYEAAVMAVALGARVFEKHFTLSHNLPGPDHWFSENPNSLKQWVEAIRKAYRMLGFSDLRPTDKELEMKTTCHRSITVLKDIKAGAVLTESNLGMRRPGTGISPVKWDEVIGKKAKRDIKAGEQISWEDING